MNCWTKMVKGIFFLPCAWAASLCLPSLYFAWSFYYVIWHNLQKSKLSWKLYLYIIIHSPSPTNSILEIERNVHLYCMFSWREIDLISGKPHTHTHTHTHTHSELFTWALPTSEAPPSAPSDHTLSRQPPHSAQSLFFHQAPYTWSSLPTASERCSHALHSDFSLPSWKRHFGVHLNLIQKPKNMDFPNGSVVKKSPANAGDMGLIPGQGRAHIPQSN